MSVETRLLGETAAECMESLEEGYADEEATMIAVGIVAVVKAGDETWTRTWCSRHFYFEQLGLFENALDVVRNPEE